MSAIAMERQKRIEDLEAQALEDAQQIALLTAERDDLKSKLERKAKECRYHYERAARLRKSLAEAERGGNRLDVLEGRVEALEGKSMLSQRFGPIKRGLVPIAGDPRTQEAEEEK